MRRDYTVFVKEERLKWYAQVERERRSITETCQIFGISRKTYHKWRKRDFGLSGNRYVSGKHQPNTKLTYEVRQFIEEEKWKTNYGPEKMRLHVKRALGLTLSTTIIYRLYRKRKLIRRPQKKQPWYAPLKEKLLITQPGEGVQIDVKYVYEGGVRKYQFSVFDPFTEKYAFLVCSTKESQNAVLAFKRAERYFGFKLVSVQTDNGSEFRGNFHRWLEQAHIPHFFIPKKSPWWNGKVERVHRTMDEEYYHNPYRAWKTREEWLHYYNYERIHLSINGMTPHEKYLSVVTGGC